jgi:hypothetical protein
LKLITTLLAAIVLMVGSAFAQNGAFAPYVVGTIQTAPGSASTGASYNAGVGIESSTKHLLLDVNGSFNSSNVTSGSGNGYTGTLQAQGYLKISHLLAGGGANWVINSNGFSASRFISTARESANPFVGVGLQLGRLRSIATYELPGRDALQEQIKFGLNNELRVTKHVRFVVPLTINSYQSGPLKSLGGQRVSVAEAGAGVKFVF